MQVVGQDHRRLDRERMPRSNVAKCSAKQSNMVGQETQSTVSQVDGKEIAAAWNEIAPIAGHTGRRSHNRSKAISAKEMGLERAQPILRATGGHPLAG